MKRLVVNAFCPGKHKVISGRSATCRQKNTAFGPAHRKVDELRNSEVSGKSRRVLLTPIGEARLTSKLCPCDLDENTRSKDRVRDKFGHFGLWLSLVERLVRDNSFFWELPLLFPVGTNESLWLSNRSGSISSG